MNSSNTHLASWPTGGDEHCNCAATGGEKVRYADHSSKGKWSPHPAPRVFARFSTAIIALVAWLQIELVEPCRCRGWRIASVSSGNRYAPMRWGNEDLHRFSHQPPRYPRPRSSSRKPATARCKCVKLDLLRNQSRKPKLARRAGLITRSFGSSRLTPGYTG